MCVCVCVVFFFCFLVLLFSITNLSSYPSIWEENPVDIEFELKLLSYIHF